MLLHPEVLAMKANDPIATLLKPVCVILPEQQPTEMFPPPVVYPKTDPNDVGVAGEEAEKGAPLMYSPVLSTFTRSQVPAPSRSVHTHPAAAGNEPIIVLLLPVVIKHPPQAPIAMLLAPALIPYSALYPCAMLLDPYDPHESPFSACLPIAMLFDPVVLAVRA
jgi:hypothetical protein